jgi:hypothetical protein
MQREQNHECKHNAEMAKLYLHLYEDCMNHVEKKSKNNNDNNSDNNRKNSTFTFVDCEIFLNKFGFYINK